MRRVAVSFAVAAAVASVMEAGDFTRDIPRAAWEPIFFGSINRLTAQAGCKGCESGRATAVG